MTKTKQLNILTASHADLVAACDSCHRDDCNMCPVNYELNAREWAARIRAANNGAALGTCCFMAGVA